MIYRFNDFLLEFSSDSAFPELLQPGKKAIFLFGVPGVGKTFFTENIILPILKTNYKLFDPESFMKVIKKIVDKGKLGNVKQVKKTDQERLEKIEDIKDAMAIFFAQYGVEEYLTDEEIGDIVDRNLYYEGSYDLLKKRMFTFLKSNKTADFVYDTTGNDFNRIKQYTEMVKEYGYKVIFIKVKSSVKTAVKGNLGRTRRVQMDYQLSSIERSEELDSYLDLEPNAYYIYKRDENILLKYYGGDLKLEKENLIKNG